MACSQMHDTLSLSPFEPKCFSAAECSSCGHQFPRPGQQKFKSCPACSALNISSAVSCNSCGASFQVGFVLTLDEALRAGAVEITAAKPLLFTLDSSTIIKITTNVCELSSALPMI